MKIGPTDLLMQGFQLSISYKTYKLWVEENFWRRDCFLLRIPRAERAKNARQFQRNTSILGPFIWATYPWVRIIMVTLKFINHREQQHVGGDE